MEDNNLSKEEMKILEEMKSNWKKNIIDEKLFWRDIYPKYSFDEKVSYWSQTLNQQMRWQAESGLDEYTIFSRDWYISVKGIEPNIDRIIAMSFEKFLSWEWSQNEYLKRIQV